jgi:hypothetical protein
MGEHKLRSHLDNLVSKEEREARFVVAFLERLLRNESAWHGLAKIAATAALVAATGSVEERGLKLSFSPAGITWKVERKAGGGELRTQRVALESSLS